MRSVILLLLAGCAAAPPIDEAVPARAIQLGSTRLRHSACITCLSFSSDGSMLASGDQDGTVRIWAVPDGRKIALMRVSASPCAIAWNPSGRTVAIAVLHTVELWSVATCQLEDTWVASDKPVTRLAFSPDGAWIAAYSAGFLRLRRPESTEEKFEFDCAGAFAFSPDGSRLAMTYSGSIALRIVRVDDGRLLRELRSRENLVLSLSMPDSETLVAGTAKGIVRWPCDHDEPDAPPLTPSIFHHEATAFSTRGVAFLAAHEDNIVVDAQEGRVIVKFKEASVTTRAALSPDGRLLAHSEGDGVITLRELPSGHVVRRGEGHSGAVRQVAFAPDGARVVTLGDDGRILAWDSVTGVRIGVASPAWPVRTFAFAPDGEVTLFDERGMYARRGVYFAVSRNPSAVVPIPGTALVIVLSGGSSMETFSLDTGDRLESRAGTHVELTPDGRYLAIAEMGTIVLSDRRTGLERMRVPSKNAALLVLTPDGSRLCAIRSGASLEVLDGSTGASLVTVSLERINVRDVASSPRHALFATAGATGCHVWSAITGEMIQQIDGAGTCVAFSPDGARLAIGRHDGRSIVLPLLYPAVDWDAARRANAAPPRNPGMARLIARLEGDDIAVREEAARAIQSAGPLAEGELLMARDCSSTEAKGQIDKLLAVMAGAATARHLEALRAVAALELDGSPRARAMLERISQTASGARVQHEARLALGRLERAK